MIQWLKTQIEKNKAKVFLYIVCTTTSVNNNYSIWIHHETKIVKYCLIIQNFLITEDAFLNL